MNGGENGNKALHRLAYFSRFFQFGKNQRAYMVIGSLLLANGISHGVFAYHYYKDPEGFKESLARLPKYFQSSANEVKSEAPQPDAVQTILAVNDIPQDAHE